MGKNPMRRDTVGAQTESSHLSKSQITSSSRTPNSVAAICDPLGPFCLAARVSCWDFFPSSRVLLLFTGNRGGSDRRAGLGLISAAFRYPLSPPPAARRVWETAQLVPIKIKDVSSPTDSHADQTLLL